MILVDCYLAAGDLSSPFFFPCFALLSPTSSRRLVSYRVVSCRILHTVLCEYSAVHRDGTIQVPYRTVRGVCASWLFFRFDLYLCSPSLSVCECALSGDGTVLLLLLLSLLVLLSLLLLLLRFFIIS
ncbi:unnamed protein product, partial [Tuber aestivum]